MRKFNVTGTCIPRKHYMVDITNKLEQIKDLVDAEEYFTINRGRQYGKTTTLAMLQHFLADEYTVISLSFQGVGNESFAHEEAFCSFFLKNIAKALRLTSESEAYRKEWNDSGVKDFDALKHHISNMCDAKKLVLMIDEVDQVSNHFVFLSFLGVLRELFLVRDNGIDSTFHSVILAGVYDIKNMKLKLVSEGLHATGPTETKIQNSPWNIAVNFNVEMSFNSAEIATMLVDYEADHHTGMNVKEISDEIYHYTNGYPFLVSRICQCVHLELEKNWTRKNIQEAIKILLDEKNTLFDDLYKNLINHQTLANMLKNILLNGIDYTFNHGTPEIDLGVRYGFLTKKDRIVAVSNKVFELLMTDYFISQNELNMNIPKITGIREEVIQNDVLNMELCLRKFSAHYAEMYSLKKAPFFEEYGRLLLLTYLIPIINGQGFYYIENETLNQNRMDIVIHYGQEEFVLELKIWRGEAYQSSAYSQLIGYLESRQLDQGYLITFDFRKSKKSKAEWVEVEGKRIFDIII